MNIRPATVNDFPAIHALILEFAEFQKTPEKVTITPEQLIKEEAFFNCLVVTKEETIVGFASYYFAYSSWSGKSLYLDDIYLKPELRGQDLGNNIMDKLEAIAKENNCAKMRWLVSKWNESAIGFYKKRGATIYDTEYTCEVDL
jgi:ribosomal protein S18 acetylase RimI-like enzyme